MLFFPGLNQSLQSNADTLAGTSQGKITQYTITPILKWTGIEGATQGTRFGPCLFRCYSLKLPCWIKMSFFRKIMRLVSYKGLELMIDPRGLLQICPVLTQCNLEGKSAVHLFKKVTIVHYYASKLSKISFLSKWWRDFPKKRSISLLKMHK